MKIKTQHTEIYGTWQSSGKRKFIAINAYIITQERSQFNNLTLQLKDLEKEE